ncbi:MAG: ATP-binding cassette domain-containing protein, partial [Burkholderiaceae bacterium]
MNPVLLAASRVSKRFGGLHAVQNVSLGVERGSITALIGPNGAGKTTLFALVSGFLRPDEGEVIFGEPRLAGLAPRAAAELRPWISFGARRMVVEALTANGAASDDGTVDRLLAAFLTYYEA